MTGRKSRICKDFSNPTHTTASCRIPPFVPEGRSPEKVVRLRLVWRWDGWPAAHDEGAELSVSLRNAASRLPYDNRVRHPPPGRRKHRQARLSGRDAVIIGRMRSPFVKHRALL